MASCYVKAFFDWVEATAALSDAERGRLFISILEYARSGLEPKLDGRESILWPTFKLQIDRDKDLSAGKAENGRKGGKQTQANSSKFKQIQAKSVKEEKDKDKDKEKDKEKDEEKDKDGVSARSRFTPPSVADVEAYCLERGNSVDPEHFVDFYTSKGWKVGKETMHDWKASVRTWEKTNEHTTHKSRKAQELDDAYAMSERWAANG